MYGLAVNNFWEKEKRLNKEGRDKLFIEQLVAEGLLRDVDLFFAESLLGNISTANEDASIFLAYLLAATRLGHLCVYVEEQSLSPHPAILWENCRDCEASSFEMWQKELTKRVIKGKGQIPPQIVSVVDDDPIFPSKPIALFKSRYYLQCNWVCETQIIRNLRKRALGRTERMDEEVFPHLKKLYQKKILLKEQFQSIKSVLENRMTLICGGPGTGKTYTAAYIVYLHAFFKKEVKIVAAAVTGKAICNLHTRILNCLEGQDLSFEAMTLHSLLKLGPGWHSLLKEDVLDFDVVIVDEASMIDVRLMAYLLERIKPQARLVLIGDPNQLPPIEAGNIFSDLAKNKVIASTVFLKKCIRFESEKIYQLAQAINQTDIKRSIDLLEDNRDSSVTLISLPSKEREVRDLILAYSEKFYLPPSFTKGSIRRCLDAFSDFRILASLRKGPFGVDRINQMIWQHLRKNVSYNEWWIAPIIVTKNDHNLNIYNGMLGMLVERVKGNFSSERKIYFLEKDKYISLPALLVPHFELAYCLSVHKCQGSEFKRVLLLAFDCSATFGKEMLYTAVTRAKKKLEIVGKKEVIAKMISISSARTSGLLARLGGTF